MPESEIVLLPRELKGKYKGAKFEIIRHNRMRWEAKVFFRGKKEPSMTGIKKKKSIVVDVIKNMIDNGIKNA